MWQFHTTHDVHFRAVGFYSYTLLSEVTEAVMGQLVSVWIWEVCVCVDERVRVKRQKEVLDKMLWLSNSKGSFTPRTITRFAQTDDNVLFIISVNWSYAIKCLSWAWVDSDWLAMFYHSSTRKQTLWKWFQQLSFLCRYRNSCGVEL